LTTTIREYEKGSWFKRGFWIFAPNWGETVLTVHGDLKDSASGTVVGTVDVSRTIHGDHPFAFAAWVTIFRPVCEDIVEELRPGAQKG
jgi:hypothetical protein